MYAGIGGSLVALGIVVEGCFRIVMCELFLERYDATDRIRVWGRIDVS